MTRIGMTVHRRCGWAGGLLAAALLAGLVGCETREISRSPSRWEQQAGKEHTFERSDFDFAPHRGARGRHIPGR